jgi:hypothetical protein
MPRTPKHDALAWISKSKYQSRPITSEQAKEYVDLLVGYDDDLRAYALIRLVSGIFDVAHEYYRRNGETNPEDVFIEALQLAYNRTLHSNRAYYDFVAIDWRNERDLRALRHEFESDEERESNAGGKGDV